MNESLYIIGALRKNLSLIDISPEHFQLNQYFYELSKRFDESEQKP